MDTREIPLWGAADLTPFSTPVDEHGNGFPRALSFALPMTPEIMAGIQNGPNQAYADEYARVNMKIPCGPAKERSHCGKCRLCVETCPAGALTGQAWYPGIPRKDILDVRRCDQWKKEHYFEYHQGHNCGICSAVCPYGTKNK